MVPLPPKGLAAPGPLRAYARAGESYDVMRNRKPSGHKESDEKGG